MSDFNDFGSSFYGVRKTSEEFKNFPVQEGVEGIWSIEKFFLDSETCKFENMRFAMNMRYEFRVRPGEYIKLSREGHVVMSNTPMEINSHDWIINIAEGNVLISGLGLGAVLWLLLKKPEVTSITILEKSKDVIKLIGKYFDKDPRVTILNVDALTWTAPTGIKYDYVWHDIWDDVCGDNVETMGVLHRKYGGRCKEQNSWMRWRVKQENKRNWSHPW